MTKIIDFLKYVNDNTEFRKKIEEKENLYGLNSKKTKESYKIFLEKEIIPIAKKHGFSFTANDYINFMKDNIKKPLSEDDLEEISGGKGKVFLPIAIAAVSFFQGPFSQSMTYAMSPSNIVVQNENKSSQTQISSETKESLLREFTSIHETLKWKLIMDGRFHYANNPLACDEGLAGADEEEGYCDAMLNALNYAFSDDCMNEQLNFKLYSQLNKKATQNRGGVRRSGEQVAFGIIESNSSAEGKTQYNNKQNSSWQSDRLFHFGIENVMLASSGIRDPQSAFPNVKLANPSPSFLPPISKHSRGMRHTVDLIFEEYYSKLSELNEKGVVEGTLISENASIEDKKLEIIIRICQNLDQLHAFRDGNIRTIAFLVMQRMLIENCLSPTIFNDPNCIDLKSVGEIMQALKEGQETYKKIVEESNQIKQKEST